MIVLRNCASFHCICLLWRALSSNGPSLLASGPEKSYFSLCSSSNLQHGKPTVFHPPLFDAAIFATFFVWIRRPHQRKDVLFSLVCVFNEYLCLATITLRELLWAPSPLSSVDHVDCEPSFSYLLSCTCCARECQLSPRCDRSMRTSREKLMWGSTVNGFAIKAERIVCRLANVIWLWCVLCVWGFLMVWNSYTGNQHIHMKFMHRALYCSLGPQEKNYV